MIMKIIFYCSLLVSLVAGSASAQDTTRLSLLFAGDVMGHDSQIASAYDARTNTYDYSSCFAFIKPYIASADLAIANLEVTLAGPPYKGYPQFSSPDQLAVALKDMGFDALVTSNNHCVDRGKKGLERTIDILKSLGIPHTGTFKDSASRASEYPLMLYKNGFSIALLNYTYGTNGLPVHKPNIVNMIDTVQIRKDIDVAKKAKPDVIIVFTHWGQEYQSLPNKAQKDVTEFCFRKGAHLVIGAHPHVIQPMEWRKERNQFVAYSLGNFVSGQRKRYTDGGSLAYLELQKVFHSPDSATVTIDSAGYYLEWVYRTTDKSKDYYILPASDGDKANLTLIKDSVSEEAYRLFLKDSRALYLRHNKNVNEITGPAERNVTTYRVVLLTTVQDEDPWKLLTSQNQFLWGVDRFDTADGKVLWTSGNFDSEEKADQYRQRYSNQLPESKVVKFVNGKPE
jgi:poly-gamma-glutamate capsule biosynthesis protein CapA/YwtB (metallophosphatase superfamily)